MFSVFRSRPLWAWGGVLGLAILVTAAIVLRPRPLSETERMMLGTWRWKDSRIAYTFREDRRVEIAFDDGPSYLGRWAASNGSLETFQTYADPPPSFSEFVARLRRAIRPPVGTGFTVDFALPDEMQFNSPFVSQVLTRVK